jgi:hypothetical protein
MRLASLPVALLGLFCLCAAMGDALPAGLAGEGSGSFGETAAPLRADGKPGDFGLTEDQVRIRTRILLGGAVGVVGVYGATVWWNEGISANFRTVNEGWFGQDTYTGGADKLGHAYSAYVGTRLLTLGFQWAGNDRDRSLGLAAATVVGTMVGIEVLDGFSRRYRFSKEDAIMDLLGVGAGLLLEKRPDLDRAVDFRVHYWPSQDARRLNEVDPIADHSGQTYLVALKAAAFPALRRQGPLRYLELAAGYGSRGYEPNDGTGRQPRSRHVYFGISLNVSEILADTVFRGTSRKSLAQRMTDTVLEFVQVPGTAIPLVDHRL